MRQIEKRRNILVELVDTAGKIRKKINIHRIVYILQQLGAPFEERFKYNYYGPYSPTLELEIDELVDVNMIQVTESEPGIHTYTSTIKSSTSFLSKYKPVIKFLATLPSYMLELVATLFYLKEHYGNNEKFLKSKLSILKPDLKQYFDEAFHLCHHLEESIHYKS